MKDPLSFFKESFEDSREAFINLARSSGGELRSHKIPSEEFSNLTFESLYLAPTSEKRERLLILTSGIHGIEGFMGSALQRYFIENDFLQLKDENMGILIIHGINPYGFKAKRRVTEKNVDLNRNFDSSNELFLTQNPGYDKVASFLNPSAPYTRHSFNLGIGLNILKYGVSALRRAIVMGQYKFPEGIFFGGKEFEPQVSLIRNEVLRVGEGYDKVLLIDLHTGYGQKEKLHLFGNTSTFIDQKFMDQVFEGLSVDYGEEKDFYTVTGGFTVFLAKLFHQKAKYAGVCFEFGTIDSQNLSGSLDSLYRMINEKKEKKLFEEMFYPSSMSLRKSAIEQFEKTLRTIIKNF